MHSVDISLHTRLTERGKTPGEKQCFGASDQFHHLKRYAQHGEPFYIRP